MTPRPYSAAPYVAALIVIALVQCAVVALLLFGEERRPRLAAPQCPPVTGSEALAPDCLPATPAATRRA